MYSGHTIKNKNYSVKVNQNSYEEMLVKITNKKVHIIAV